jgi:hypothetical protein
MAGFDGGTRAFRAFNNYFRRRRRLQQGGGGADCINVSATAGSDQEQAHCSQISVTGSRAGGSGFTYAWKLYDPQGNDISSRLTGSTDLSCSYLPYNDIGGTYVQKLTVENSVGSIAKVSSTTEIGTHQWIRLRPDDATYSFDAGLNGTPVWADDGTETSITIEDAASATDQPSESLIKSILVEGITWGDVDSIHLDVRVGTVQPASADGFLVGMIMGDSNVPTTYNGLTTLSKIGATSTVWTMDTKPGNDAWTMTGTGTSYNAILTVINMARTTATFKSAYVFRYAVNYGASANAHRDGFFTEDVATTDPVHLGMLVNRSTGGSGADEATFQFRYKIMKKKA